MINSRPLTYVYDDVMSTIIRPMDFLQCGGPIGIAPVGVFDDPDYVPPQQRKEFFNLYKANLSLIESFWHLFKDEYPSSLRERQTMIHSGQGLPDKSTPQVGDIVLVKEIDLRRGEWKLGRIQKIDTQHGYIKAVTVILSNRQQVERLISWLYPVESSDA